MFFFFKQKTAYEMRISDWSSDVCSSDLDAEQHADRVRLGDRYAQHHLPGGAGGGILRGVEFGVVELAPPQVVAQRQAAIGEVRIEERERVALQVDVALDRKSTRLNSSH